MGYPYHIFRVHSAARRIRAFPLSKPGVGVAYNAKHFRNRDLTRLLQRRIVKLCGKISTIVG